MISFLEGEVVERSANRVVLGVGGVGYDVFVPTSVAGRLPTGRTVRVYTRMIVRDDAMTLYGFSATEERELFDLLTGVTGVGPNLIQQLDTLITFSGTLASSSPADTVIVPRKKSRRRATTPPVAQRRSAPPRVPLLRAVADSCWLDPVSSVLRRQAT